jgi:hypothetical protein
VCGVDGRESVDGAKEEEVFGRGEDKGESDDHGC